MERQLSFLGFYSAIGALQQQPSHYLGITVDCGQEQGRLTVFISGIDINVGKSKQVSCHFLTAIVCSPVQRGASLLIPLVDIYLFLEVDQRGYLVILSSHVQYIKFGLIHKQRIGSNFLQIPNEFDMTVEGCVEERSEALLIFLVNPDSNLLFGVLMIQLSRVSSLSFDKLTGVENV